MTLLDLKTIYFLSFNFQAYQLLLFLVSAY